MKLHVGCGIVYLPSYINSDIQLSPTIDLVCDAARLPFPEESVDLIYSCALIEHFGRQEWETVLAHWWRKLKFGGLLRISTADFESITRRYSEMGNLNELLGLIVGGQKDHFDWHGMVFDYRLLTRGLRMAGFRFIRRYNWKMTEMGALNIDDYSQAYLPHMDKQCGRLMMLNVEAGK